MVRVPTPTVWDLLVRISESNTRQTELTREFADNLRKWQERYDKRLDRYDERLDHLDMRVDKLIELQIDEAGTLAQLGRQVAADVKAEWQAHAAQLQLQALQLRGERREEELALGEERSQTDKHRLIVDADGIAGSVPWRSLRVVWKVIPLAAAAGAGAVGHWIATWFSR